MGDLYGSDPRLKKKKKRGSHARLRGLLREKLRECLGQGPSGGHEFGDFRELTEI